MWDDFDEQAIDRDLELLEQAGIFLLRVFPMWHVFQPIHALILRAVHMNTGLGRNRCQIQLRDERASARRPAINLIYSAGLRRSIICS